MITDQHLNTGAMALGALPEEEAVLFVDHLETCPECTSELTGFQETAAALGGSVAQTPPASLRRSVMAAIAQTPQLPPLTVNGTALGRHRQAAEDAAMIAAASPDLTGDTARTRGSGKLADVIPMRRAWYRRPQALLAAAVAVLVIGGGTALVVSQQSSSTPSVASGPACVAAATNKSTLGPTVGTGGVVTLAPACDTALVKVPSLPDAPSGKVYQLWVIRGAGSTASTTSVGVLNKSADGTYGAIPANVHAGDTAVGVTVEPGPNGSAKPTTKPLWVVPLSA